jgi:hypothetical protein
VKKLVHKIVQTKKKRWIVFKQVPEKIGKFGEWKIIGNKATEAEAKAIV